MNKDSRIVIIGAGVFGLTTATQLALQGFRNILVVDRSLPPVPDGSSVDISRLMRFDYADEVYLRIAYEAYKRWSQSARYEGIFYRTPFILTSSGGGGPATQDKSYIQQATAGLTKLGLPWTELPNADAAKRLEPALTGPLSGSNFYGYRNEQAGWIDAEKAITQLRDDCIQQGISFVSGTAGTVVGFDTDPEGKIRAARTLSGRSIEGDLFVLAAGAWASSLVSTYNSTLSTAQIVGYIRLSDAEMERYKDLPTYIDFSKGWFNFPPHADSRMLKMAVHGWGYTRSPSDEEKRLVKSDISSPPLRPVRKRPEFVPADGEARLREGLYEILPEIADRKFEKLVLCWYTDTPTGDFVMDYHPDHPNLFMAGGGSGHAFKFLPVLGEYTVLSMEGKLPPNLRHKWRFHKEYQGQPKVFQGDGSRGGPLRRELTTEERAKL